MRGLDGAGETWYTGFTLNISHPLLTRCDLIIVEPAQGWNVFKQIFIDHWDGFKHVHPRYNTHYYDGLVDKMLGCGNPDKMGSIA